MSIQAEATRVIELFQFPFMQRAVLGGVLTGVMGGMLGSFTILRQLSFFSDALGHSALLGISIGLLLGINPSVVLIPFAVAFALGVTYLLERTRLWTDALLNIIYSSSLAIAVIVLSFVGQYKGGIVCTIFIGLTLRTQMLLTLNEPLAIARGVSVTSHRTAFIVLLSLVVAVSIKSIGVLLISGFVVIPACASRLLSRNFSQYIMLSAALGGISAVIGMLLSALFNLPSGPSIVVTQLSIFLVAALLPRLRV
jgi:zinc/manganese transport system permease protein